MLLGGFLRHGIKRGGRPTVSRRPKRGIRRGKRR